MEELIHPTELRYLQVIPATPDLTGAEVELVNLERREFRLREALRAARRPSTTTSSSTARRRSGLLTLNALAAADSVLIPLQCEYYALEGLSQLMHTIELVQQGLNPEPRDRGHPAHHVRRRAPTSPTRWPTRCAATSRSWSSARSSRATCASPSAPSFGKPILLYDIKSKGCESYLALGQRNHAP